jgi:hypothetical protein
MTDIISLSSINQLPAGIEFLILENKDLAEARGSDVIFAVNHIAPVAYTEYFVSTLKDEEERKE